MTRNFWSYWAAPLRRNGFDEGLELPYGDQELVSVFLGDDIDHMLAAPHAIADGDLGTML